MVGYFGLSLWSGCSEPTLAGENIYNEGEATCEIIRTPEIEQGEFSRLRGIQSYRLVISKHTLRTNGDKL